MKMVLAAWVCQLHPESFATEHYIEFRMDRADGRTFFGGCRSKSSSNHLTPVDLRIGNSHGRASAEFGQLHIGCTACGFVETAV